MRVADVTQYDVKLKRPRASLFQPLTPGWTAFVRRNASAARRQSDRPQCYILSGEVKIGGKACQQHHTEVLSAEADQSGVQLEAISDAVRMIVVAGQPLDQPIFQHGPFVLQSREEAIQAIKCVPSLRAKPRADVRRDYQLGQNGFEGAAAWLAARS